MGVVEEDHALRVLDEVDPGAARLVVPEIEREILRHIPGHEVDAADQRSMVPLVSRDLELPHLEGFVHFDGFSLELLIVGLGDDLEVLIGVEGPTGELRHRRGIDDVVEMGMRHEDRIELLHVDLLQDFFHQLFVGAEARHPEPVESPWPGPGRVKKDLRFSVVHKERGHSQPAQFQRS